MSIKVGDIAPEFSEESVSGKNVELEKGQVTLLTFFRFASCPFCNLRLRELQQFSNTHSNIEVVGIFGSPKGEVEKSISIHNLTFPLISDTHGNLYREYGIKKSFLGMIKGMVTRFPTLMKAIFIDHFIPLRTHGHLLTMPAEFLVDNNGVVKVAHYGSDEGDHIDLTIIDKILSEKIK